MLIAIIETVVWNSILIKYGCHRCYRNYERACVFDRVSIAIVKMQSVPVL